MPEYDEPVLTNGPGPSAYANPLPIPHGYDAVPELPVASPAQHAYDNPLPIPHGYDVVPELPSTNFVPPRAPYATPHPSAGASLGIGPPLAGAYDYAQPPAASGGAYDYVQPALGTGPSGNTYSRAKGLSNPAAPIGNPAAPINAAVAAPAAPPIAPAHPMPRLELGVSNPDQAIVDATRNRMFPKTKDTAFRTKGMADGDGHYQHEATTAAFRGKGPLGNIFTKYWNDAEQDAHQIGADKESGSLGFLGSDTQMNTIGATGEGTWNGEGKDKFIYTMDGKGAMRAVDPAARNEWARMDMPGLAAPATDRGDKQLGLVNHSSTVRGKDVAAAGDMTVRDGRLETLSNISGHYRPDVGMLHQAAHTIGTKGAMHNDTQIDMERGPEGRHQTSALKFLGASMGQEDIAQSAFGTRKATEQTEATAANKADLMQEIRDRVPKR